MPNNIESDTSKFCTGCGACINICPVNAITYKIDEYGFYKAFVDNDKCIGCGKCKNVCLKFETDFKNKNNLKDGKFYAAQSLDKKVISETTSGGIAYEIGKYGIENGYKVLGTIYDYEKNIAKTIIASSKEELELTKGSKYLQSNTEEAINKLLIECKNNKDAKFIVFGTPCQIAGISKLIETEKITNQIIKVDLFCHGVPSYFVWNKYMKQFKEKYGLDEFKKINFRSKYYGWIVGVFEFSDVNGKTKYESGQNSDFNKTFYDNMFLNKSCYDCEVRKEKSFADIRLGDFWGRKYYNHREGMSAVVVFTDIGKKLLENINIMLIDEKDGTECLKYQAINKYTTNDLNDKYLKELKNTTNLSKLIKDYRSNMSRKKQIKLKMKAVSDKVPPTLKYNLKRIYYSIYYKE